jgi:CheY-like chemotaxis protein
METLRITFANIGLTDYVHYLSNGQEAIDFCIKEATNCIQHYQKVTTIVILDQTMPYKSGAEALQEIKAFYQGLHKPNEDGEVLTQHIRMPKFAMFSAY